MDFCPHCLGIWFEEDELRLAKDERDKSLRWLDIDLWKNKKDFEILLAPKLCPKCRLPLYEVNYGSSDIKVDLCNLCHGIWLDRGEFKKIIDYLKEKESYEALNNYLKNLSKQALEIFVGPENLRSEVLDFLAILKLLNYKIVSKHPLILEMISKLPLTK